MLSGEHLADALVTADIARDAVLSQQYTPGAAGLAELLDMGGTDRIVIYQATGMIAVQLNDTTSNALARLRAAAYASGRPMYDIAQDVVERRRDRGQRPAQPDHRRHKPELRDPLRDEKAAIDAGKADGIDAEELPGFYRGRTRLGVNVYPEDVAEARRQGSPDEHHGGVSLSWQ